MKLEVRKENDLQIIFFNFIFWLDRNGVFEGIPVIFVPGNGGSYKQVRSLGSIALRMLYENPYKVYFDFFTVDFDEELSGVYGKALERQTVFLHEAIRSLKELYGIRGDKSRDFRAILIAHSVGGIVCKGLYTFSDFDQSNVAVLITLSTPHVRPVLAMDRAIASFYARVQLWWKKNRNRGALAEVPIISIHGGLRDHLVNSDLTKLEHVSHLGLDFHTLSSAIPDVWVEADHVCIVWCRQLIKKLVRLLFDLADERTGTLKIDADLRRRVIEYHLFDRNREKRFPEYAIPDSLTSPKKKSEILTVEHRFFAFIKNKLIDLIYITLLIKPNTTIVISASGLDRMDWLFGCHQELSLLIDANDKSNSSNAPLCKQSVNLSLHARLVPTTKSSIERKLFVFDANELHSQGLDHLVIFLSPHSKPLEILSERFTERRQQTLQLPSFIFSLFTFFAFNTVLKVPVSEESLYYSLRLDSFHNMWHSYELRLQIISCYEKASGTVLIHKHVPWFREDEYFLMVAQKDSYLDFSLKLNVLRPDDSSKSARLNLLLDPHCGYSLQARFAPLDALTQTIRFNSHMLLPSVAALLLSIFALQLQAKSWSKITSFPEFKQTVGCLDKYVSACDLMKHKCFAISLATTLPFANLFFFHSLLAINSILNSDHLTYLLTNLNLDHLQLPQVILLHGTLFSLVYACVFTILWVVEFIIKLAASFLQRFLWSKKKDQTINVGGIVLCTVLVGVVAFSCSSIALALLILVHMLRTVALCARGQLLRQKHGLTRQSTLWHLHITLLLLLLTAFLPLLPVGLVWLNKRLSMYNYVHDFIDHQQLVVLFLVLAMGLFWQQTFFNSMNR